jgi:hypothetical protein
MTPPAGDTAAPDIHLCIHEADWSEFREFKSASEAQMQADTTFRTDILGEIKGLRIDVMTAMTKMGEYLGMGKMVKFGVAVFCSAAGAVAAILGAGHAMGWW